MTHERITIDLTPVQIEVQIGEETYLLREATGDGACKYMDSLILHTNTVNGESVPLPGLGKSETLLVSLCLFDSEGKPVTQNVISNWPARIQKQLFNEASKISNINQDSEDIPPAKN